MISFNNLGNMGHIGNQMFQYASLKGIAKNNNLDWCIPPKELFGINYELRSNIYDCFNLIGLKEKNINYTNNISNHETSLFFNYELFNNFPDNTDLIGYFQSEKYFLNIQEEIRNDFLFKDSILMDAKEKIHYIDEEYASLHIRRTDYTISSHVHNNLDLEYYEKAISLIPENIKIIIFSDNIDWCKNQKIFNNNRFVFSDNYVYLDLYLMSRARYSIIANSSFSWWGAWLGKEKEIIIAPERWYNNNLNESTKDLIPEKWIRI